MILEYGSEESPLSLITKIGSTEVTTDMIDGNVLKCGNMIIECNTELDTYEIGKYEVTYLTSDSNNRTITKTVQVADTIAPSVVFEGLNEDDALELTLEEFKNYNFSNNIKVSDNYDLEPQVSVSVDEISKNDYTILVTAIDCFGNEQSAHFIVKIKEETTEINENVENEEVKANVDDGEDNKSSNSNNSSSSNSSSSSGSTSKPSSGSSGSNASSGSSKSTQYFYFGETYTLNGEEIECNMQNVFQLCSSRMSGNSECIPITDENGIYLGMQLNFY